MREGVPHPPTPPPRLRLLEKGSGDIQPPAPERTPRGYPGGGREAGGGILLIAAVALLVYLNVRPAPTQVRGACLGEYATSLAGRTQGQRHNALKAAREIDGVVIAPGATFSYNRTIKAFSSEPGYWKAPVSYGGAMTLAVGGGVCQTSTTLYNAALLAGLEIVERHPHTVLPHYVPPGRDAAVAFPGLDLRVKNPYPFAVRLRARRDGESLTVKIVGPKPTARTASIRTQLLSVAPATRRISEGGGTFRRTRAAAGCRVLSWRVVTENGKEVRRERLADDTYVALDQLLTL